MTLYPFRFAIPAGASRWALPVLLQSGMKRVRPLDDFLNVLLFVPFGFGLAGLFPRRGNPRSRVILVVLGVGAAFSYTIEFMQFYVPFRDSGWHDVMTNSVGAMVGSILFDFVGVGCLKMLSRAEIKLTSLVSWRRAIVLFCAYYAVWLAVSVPLQERSQLSNWDSNCPLVIGNLGFGRPATAWKGDLYRIEFWDRALPENEAMRITSGERLSVAGSTPIAAYDFTRGAPYKDIQRKLPDLTWIAGKAGVSTPPDQVVSGTVALDGKSLLTTKSPAEAIVNASRKTNQFSVLVTCRAADPMGEDKRIFSLSSHNGITDLDFGQNEGDLVLMKATWFFGFETQSLFAKPRCYE